MSLFFQNAAVGPMFGQLGFFYKFAGKAIEDKRPLERFLGETKHLLGVIDARLGQGKWIMGDEFTASARRSCKLSSPRQRTSGASASMSSISIRRGI